MAKTWIEHIMDAIPLAVYRLFLRRDVIGFLYHIVSDDDLPHIRHLYSYKNIAQFERDLDYLQDHYHLISYAQLLEQRAGKLALEAPLALLSFDDGLVECFRVIRPLLLKRNIPGIFFINTDGIDNHTMLYRQAISLCIEVVISADEARRQSALTRLSQAFGQAFTGSAQFIQWIKSLNYRDRNLIHSACQLLEIDLDGYLQARQPYVTSEQIRILAAEGFTIGAHSRSHAKLNLLSSEEIEEEIAGSCQVIGEITKQDQVPFAFPFSAYGLNRELLSEIRSRHPVVGWLFDSKGIRKDRPFIMNRIMVDQPLAGSASGTDLARHLHLAYQDALLYGMRRMRKSWLSSS
jgi:peptidoglycan/xylan/chitin deacetylase (PgdA/CDA1 family)